MIGISVSLYDKFEDLGVLIDIIRENWEEDYFISVCSNHPEAEKRISELGYDIDYFEKGADINYDDSMDEYRKSVNLKYRVYNTIRTACRGALSADGVEYMMHLHADAWPLSEKKLHKLIDEVSERNASIGFKARTRFFRNRYTPGHFSDQFIVYDADAAKSADLFQRKALDFPPDYVIHQILPMISLVKFGWDEIYHYSTRSEEMHWDGKPIFDVRNPARPMLYNPKYEQVHIATEDFDQDLGKSLQAYYLNKHGISDGPRVKSHLDSYSIPEEELFNRINEYFDSLDKRLRWYGLSSESFGRNVNHIEDFLRSPFRNKIKKVADTYGKLALSKYFRDDEMEENIHQWYNDKLDEGDYPSRFPDAVCDDID
ncbi:hypothetical protein [Halobacterium rubrum]|uniref:hypothetical protein n=1 Tax=Halobacterium TaxID=2239 RepID=UPI001F23B8BC|nr:MULTISPECIES: hypothetical protein [Halobacterium]MDH5021445.1 hypothetical protein [Halobacterium rubrum]